MSISVTLNTPLADALGNVVQPKLVEVGWSTGGLDDSALAEYIILMLVNGKTQEQIAAELSNDLLNLGPDDSGAVDFSRWLFEQVDVLNKQLNESSALPVRPTLEQSQAVGVQSVPRQAVETFSQQDSGLLNGASNQYTVMQETVDGIQDGTIPTGPKSMRNGNRNQNGNKRLFGQLSKAMDRSNDSVLHRVRPQQGTERINMHNRQPPKGPRSDVSRNRGVHPGVPTGPAASINANRGPAAGMMQMNTQQQMQLLAMYEQQARMMAELLGPQGQKMFMPGFPPGVINPAFRGGPIQQPQQPGRSLFERIEGKPQRPNGASSYTRPYQKGPASALQDVEMGNSEPSSSMEVESSQATSTELSPDTTCKFNLKCTKQDCIFAHQSPAAPPGTAIDVNDHCPFGAACKNRKCVARHPSPAQKVSHQSEQDCKYFPYCTNTSCTFRHPNMPVCRNGADCTQEGCKFTHVKTKCKFNPCLNVSCIYKHDEGQKRGAFDDKVWVAIGSEEKEHVSERKFVVADEDEEEELIVPDNSALGGNKPSLGTEVVT